jgi:hypothetical protein
MWWLNLPISCWEAGRPDHRHFEFPPPPDTSYTVFSDAELQRLCDFLELSDRDLLSLPLRGDDLAQLQAALAGVAAKVALAVASKEQQRDIQAAKRTKNISLLEAVGATPDIAAVIMLGERMLYADRLLDRIRRAKADEQEEVPEGREAVIVEPPAP